MFSTGAFVSDLLHSDDDEVQPFLELRSRFIDYCITLTMFSIVVSLIYLILMRIKFKKNAKILDEKNTSPSDYCIMASEIFYENYDKIEDEIREKLGSKNVNHVSLCYEINDYIKNKQKFIQYKKLKNIVRKYCKDNNIALESFNGKEYPNAPKE